MSNVVSIAKAEDAMETEFSPGQIRAHIQHIMPAFCEANAALDFDDIEEAFIDFYHEASELPLSEVVKAMDYDGRADFADPVIYRHFRKIAATRRANKARDAKRLMELAELLIERSYNIDTTGQDRLETALSDAESALECAEYAMQAFETAKPQDAGSVRGCLYEAVGDEQEGFAFHFCWEAMQKLGIAALPLAKTNETIN